MTPNRLTPAEVEKLSGASNLLATGLPADIKAARRLIAEVLCSAAPTIKNGLGKEMTRTPAGWNDDEAS